MQANTEAQEAPFTNKQERILRIAYEMANGNGLPLVDPKTGNTVATLAVGKSGSNWRTPEALLRTDGGRAAVGLALKLAVAEEAIALLQILEEGMWTRYGTGGSGSRGYQPTVHLSGAFTRRVDHLLDLVEAADSPTPVNGYSGEAAPHPDGSLVRLAYKE